MTNNISKLQSDLFESADFLRTNSKLNANEYAVPVLGIIFLRQATTRFNRVRDGIVAGLPQRNGVTRPLRPEDFTAASAIYLPEQSRYEYLVETKQFEDEHGRQLSMGEAINHAMELIEDQTPMLKGALPNGYTKFENDVLVELLRIFNRDALKEAEGDVFGRIYEYFLTKFSMSGESASDDGQFFTPPSLVRLIVNVIEPDSGIVFDPACGSGGMSVQTGYFIRKQGDSPDHAVTFYGQEKSDSTVNLARMNLAVHGLEGKIAQGNTYYVDRHQLAGKCSFVMANPPFNTDGIDPDKVKGDGRLFTKKKIPGISAKTEKVSNGNYLWAQYFYSYLNDTGRAGFVMASSASDAGHGEREIRKEIIATNAVDVMIAIGTNFFFTRTLPCMLWFYDKGKPIERRDKTLMIDARSIFRVVTRKINDFSDEQLANITAIVWLYRGENDRYVQLVGGYLDSLYEQVDTLSGVLKSLDEPMTKIYDTFGEALVELKTHDDTKLENGEDDELALQAIARVSAELATWKHDYDAWKDTRNTLLTTLANERQSFVDNRPKDNAEQKERHAAFEPFVSEIKECQRELGQLVRELIKLMGVATKELGIGKTDAWHTTQMRRARKGVEQQRDEATDALKQTLYWHRQVEWLQSRFPDAEYTDVLGLCKVVARDEITAKDDSLSPGRYVGVVPNQMDDDDMFEDRMETIHEELMVLGKQAQELHQTILDNYQELIA